MVVWLLMFVTCVVMIPGIMWIAGRYMANGGPKEINGLIGYRTTRSSQNEDTWRFAQVFCGRLWRRLAAAMLALSAAGMLPLLHAGEQTVSAIGLIILGVQCAVMVASIWPVERALKQTFDKNGNRIEKHER